MIVKGPDGTFEVDDEQFDERKLPPGYTAVYGDDNMQAEAPAPESIPQMYVMHTPQGDKPFSPPGQPAAPAPAAAPKDRPEGRGTLNDATWAGLGGMLNSRMVRGIISPDIVDEVKGYAKNSKEESPTASKVGEFIGETQTPESQLAGTLLGPLAKGAIQARALNKVAGRLGKIPEGKVFDTLLGNANPMNAPNAGAARMKWGINEIQNALSGKAALREGVNAVSEAGKDVAVGAGAGVGAATGHALMPGYGAELAGVAGGNIARKAVGRGPAPYRGLLRAAAQPFEDIFKAGVAPVAAPLKLAGSPATSFQIAKSAPWLARYFGMPTGEEQ